MELKEILESTKSYGVPLVFLAVLLWLAITRVGPFIAKRFEIAEKLTRDTLETCQSRWYESNKEFMLTIEREREVLERMVREIEGMRGDIRDIGRK